MPRPGSRDRSLYFDYPRYEFVRPPELDGRRITHDVAIVGAGPVGLAAALELARHGVSSVLLDDKGTLNDGSRAICIARHSLEILQQLGVSERFVGKALGWTHGTSYYGTRPVYRLEMPHSTHERFHPMYNLQQQYVELFLAEAALEEPRIDLRWLSRVTGIEVTGEGARLAIATAAGPYTLATRYVIAADGARSVVRHELGLALKGDAYEGCYVIADIRMQSQYPTERRAYFNSPGNPDSTVLLHRQPDDIWRVDYQLTSGESETDALQEGNVRRRVGAILEMVGEQAPWELEWWSLYKAYTLALDDYRHGPVLFAGDAAHLVPIFGVRGLNSGLADAMNAAWKLAYVCRGRAPPRLLDSYSPERRGATLEIFDLAAKSTKFMTPPTRGYRLLRDAALALSLRHDLARPLINPRQSQPYTYSASPLTSFAGRDRDFASGPAAGAPLVNRRLEHGSFLLDALGRGFSGLSFSPDGKLPAELAALAPRLATGDEAFTVINVRDRDAAAAYGAADGGFYLVRPDRHVAARWRTMAPDEITSAWRRALGWSAA
ncbi:MAG TPA: FAD-dependent monooxygenase [Steroidobacteraceae bacterium]|nr:FAD-dependent monooxygenase [Steroidobacteraceae bacterium]